QALVAHANYFYRDISNFIDWVYLLNEAPPYQPLNFDNNLVRGFSASADWCLNGGAAIDAIDARGASSGSAQWRIGMQYSWLDPSYSPDAGGVAYQSKYSTETLRQQWVGQLFYRNGGFTGSLSARYQERISYK